MGRGEILFINFFIAIILMYLVKKYVLFRMKFFHADESHSKEKDFWIEMYLAITLSGVFAAAYIGLTYVMLDLLKLA